MQDFIDNLASQPKLQPELKLPKQDLPKDLSSVDNSTLEENMLL